MVDLLSKVYSYISEKFSAHLWVITAGFFIIGVCIQVILNKTEVNEDKKLEIGLQIAEITQQIEYIGYCLTKSPNDMELITKRKMYQTKLTLCQNALTFSGNRLHIYEAYTVWGFTIGLLVAYFASYKIFTSWLTVRAKRKADK